MHRTKKRPCIENKDESWRETSAQDKVIRGILIIWHKIIECQCGYSEACSKCSVVREVYPALCVRCSLSCSRNTPCFDCELLCAADSVLEVFGGLSCLVATVIVLADTRAVRRCEVKFSLQQACYENVQAHSQTYLGAVHLALSKLPRELTELFKRASIKRCLFHDVYRQLYTPDTLADRALSLSMVFPSLHPCQGLDMRNPCVGTYWTKDIRVGSPLKGFSAQHQDYNPGGGGIVSVGMCQFFVQLPKITNIVFICGSIRVVTKCILSCASAAAPGDTLYTARIMRRWTTMSWFDVCVDVARGHCHNKRATHSSASTSDCVTRTIRVHSLRLSVAPFSEHSEMVSDFEHDSAAEAPLPASDINVCLWPLCVWRHIQQQARDTGWSLGLFVESFHKQVQECIQRAQNPIERDGLAFSVLLGFRSCMHAMYDAAFDFAVFYAQYSKTQDLVFLNRAKAAARCLLSFYDWLQTASPDRRDTHKHILYPILKIQPVYRCWFVSEIVSDAMGLIMYGGRYPAHADTEQYGLTKQTLSRMTPKMVKNETRWVSFFFVFYTALVLLI